MDLLNSKGYMQQKYAPNLQTISAAMWLYLTLVVVETRPP